MADFAQLKEWVQDSWKAQAPMREEMLEDYGFFDGHQWDDTTKAEMEEARKVPIVFNRVAVIIQSVAGTEINNRTEVRFIPREIGDAKPNEVLTAGAEWFRDLADAEDADSEAFKDTLICGLGWTDTTLDFDEDPEGLPTITRMDPAEMGWDHYAHAKGLSQARYYFHAAPMAPEEAEERFPGFDLADIDADWLDKSDADDHRNIAGDEYRDKGDDEEEKPDTVTIVRIQWRERVRTVEYQDPQTGEAASMPKAKWDTIAKRLPGMMPRHRAVSRWEWRQAFLGRDEILEENQPDPRASTFNAITGHWDRKTRRFYGLLRSMKDPQMYANKWLTQVLHIINSNAKGGVLATHSAVDDPRKFEESWAATDSVSWVRNLEGIREKPGVQMPAALMSLTEFAISAIRDTSGVNLELLGLRDANQPGVLEYQRRQSAMTTMAGFFDALRFYRKRQGKTILHFLRDHIAPTGRLVRIVKDDQAQYVPLAMADDTAEYDVIVDDAPQAPNEKEKAWSVIEAMMPMLVRATESGTLSMDDWADILEYSPLPSSFAEKLKARAAEEKQQPDPQQQMAMQAAQAELAKIQSEAEENQSQTMLNTAKAQQIGVETQLAPMEAQIGMAGAMQPRGIQQ